MEAEATAEAVEVALEAAAAEPERLQTAEGALSSVGHAWLSKLPRTQVWLLGTRMRGARAARRHAASAPAAESSITVAK